MTSGRREFSGVAESLQKCARSSKSLGREDGAVNLGLGAENAKAETRESEHPESDDGLYPIRSGFRARVATVGWGRSDLESRGNLCGFEGGGSAVGVAFGGLQGYKTEPSTLINKE